MASPSLLHPLGERRKSISNKSNSALKTNKIEPTDEKLSGVVVCLYLLDMPIRRVSWINLLRFLEVFARVKRG
jgi:hypothetical protein